MNPFTAEDYRIEPCPTTGCWLWVGTLNKGGYGWVRAFGRRMNLAHRVTYTIHRGAIPAGLMLDHLCRVRSCVNPDHLRTVTPKENVYAIGSLAIAKANAEKSHCPQCGGGFSVVPRGGGKVQRRCKPCSRRVMPFATTEGAR